MSDREQIRPRLLVATEAARYCGVARATIYKMPDFPPPIRLNGVTGKPYWDIRDLDAYIDALKAAQEQERIDARVVADSVLGRRTSA